MVKLRIKTAPMAVIATVLVLFSCSEDYGSDKNVNPFAGAESRIRQLMKREEVASFQVAVGRDGKIIYRKAFGLANVDSKIPATDESMALAASIEKPFFSTAMMILHERGLVDLHAPVNDYLDGAKLVACQGSAGDATVARLMLHTTGLPYGYYIAGGQTADEDRRDIDELIALSGVLVVPPGTRYQYTNIGYDIFREIARNAAGKPIKEFITDEIIKPLGLEHTAFFDSVPPADMIVTQNAGSGVLPVSFDSEGYTPLYSTATDLVRFGMFHLKSNVPEGVSVLPDSSIDMLWRYKDPGVELTNRRLAWYVGEEFGFPVLQHGGGGPGIHTRLYLIPSENVAVAFMSNAQYSNPHSDPVLAELIRVAVTSSEKFSRKRKSGERIRYPELKPYKYRGEWAGIIKGPKGECGIKVRFDLLGRPEIMISGDSCSGGKWVRATAGPKKDYGSLLWRFNACIPYLASQAPHDEVIVTLWPQGELLVGHAAAAREKDYGRVENYVLPQCLELTFRRKP